MKNLVINLLFVLTMGLLFHACKKDGSNYTTDPSAMPVFMAPDCLPSTITDGSWDYTYKYDIARRPLFWALKHDSEIISFVYEYNKYTQYTKGLSPDGFMYLDTIVVFLNKAEYIDHYIHQGNLNTFYYNSSGYLKRAINKSSHGRYAGISYIYINGNRVQEWQLVFDTNNHVKDSFLLTSYTYYENLPGKIDAFEKWFHHGGRANTNELKTIMNSLQFITFQYTYGGNDVPSEKVTISQGDTFTSHYTWNCK